MKCRGIGTDGRNCARDHRFNSGEARPIFSIVADSRDRHETNGGCCGLPRIEMLRRVRLTGIHGKFPAVLAEESKSERISFD